MSLSLFSRKRPSPTEPSRKVLGVVAGKGEYPETLIRSARKREPGLRIVVCAFLGETKPELEKEADVFRWFRVGQVSKPLDFLVENEVREAVMVGQITPSNLFNLRPDLTALMLLTSLRERNAESIFGKVADYVEQKKGIKILLATTYMEDNIPSAGHVYGPKLKKRQLDDAAFGLRVAKQISDMNIGQTILVRHGTVLAVEGMEGTNECVRRGGELGHRKDVMLVKVSKPNQDTRFDVPCVGPTTINVCHEAGVSTIIIDAAKTIILERDIVEELCGKYKITLHAMETAL